jgi:hypothetical protein
MIKQTSISTALLCICYTIISNASIEWSEQTQIQNSQSAIHAAISRDAQGNAIIIWQAYTGTSRVIRTIYYAIATKTFSGVKELGTSYAKSHPYVSMNADGKAILAWINTDQVLTTVTYANEDWQTWQPILIKHSEITDNALDLYMPQTFYDHAYLIWTGNSGLYALTYDSSNNTWSTTKTIASGISSNISAATDTLGNVIFTWLNQDNQNNNNAYATRYDIAQSWATWTPTITAICPMHNVLYCDVALSTPANSAGTGIIVWFDTQQGLQATLYSPDTPWITWNPAEQQKILSQDVLPNVQVAMDSIGNALFVWQSGEGYCMASYYTSQQSWQSWSPNGVILVDDKAIMNDTIIDPANNSIILLSSIESNQLNTLYCIHMNKADIDSIKTISRTCISTSEKMIASQLGSSTCNALIVWPSVPSKGILYVNAQEK